ncbi:MAG: OmpA family protein [Deltaproteobacteria bacterium]|nr:OmpA family protein [Deltaproteobacteria bacterium]
MILGIVSVILLVGALTAESGDKVVEEIKAAYSGNQEVRVTPKIDNFIILLDQSGSMFIKDQGKTQAKAEMAKNVMAALNERIPELGYKGSLAVFSPDKTLLGPTEYNREMFKKAIEDLPVTGRIFGNRTPLGDAILGMDGALSKTAGKTAVLIVSDGDKNVGRDALQAARTMHEKYPNVCFHALSLSQDEKGRATLQGISQLNDCLYIEASELSADPAAVDGLAKNIFYNEEVHEVMQEVVPVEAAAVIPEAIELGGVSFGFDKDELSPQAKMNLDEDLQKLSSQPNLGISVKGYTDSTGPEEYNQKLSERRAQAVHDYLASKGVSPERMKTYGYGESQPVADNSTAEGRALNRRAEITPVH